jgi:hypothetical protein
VNKSDERLSEMAQQTGDDSDSQEFRFEAIDALSPLEVLQVGAEKISLPLPEQDRIAIENRIQRKRRYRITLLEIILLVSAICVLLAMTNWIPLPIYALVLGCLVVLLLTGMFNRLPARYRHSLTALLLLFYLILAILLVAAS